MLQCNYMTIYNRLLSRDFVWSRAGLDMNNKGPQLAFLDCSDVVQDLKDAGLFDALTTEEKRLGRELTLRYAC